MGLTPTARLQLNKQLEGDLDWKAGLDAGFDNADARLVRVRTVVEIEETADPTPNEDPNADDLEVHFIGQIFVDDGTIDLGPALRDNPIVWVGLRAGLPSVDGLWAKMQATSVFAEPPVSGNADLQDVLEDLDARTTAADARLPRGHLKGLNIEKIDATDAHVTEGECRDDTDSLNMALPALLDKNFDNGGWEQGSGSSCLPDIVNPSAGDHLFVFLMTDSTGVENADWGVDDELAHTNLDGEATGYDTYRHIGFLRMDSASEMSRDFRIGDAVWYAHRTQVDMKTVMNANNTEFAHPADVPEADGIVAQLRFVAEWENTGGLAVASQLAPAITVFDQTSDDLIIRSKGNAWVAIDTELAMDDSATFRCGSNEATAGTSDFILITQGYIFRRGQDN